MEPPLHFRQALIKLGFSENEIKILVFLWHKKKATAREISQKTALSFSATHFSLANLTVRGIVQCQAKNGEDCYEICSERDLLRWVDAQKEANGGIYDRAKLQIQSFLNEIKESSWKPEVMYYEGREGIVEIYEDMLHTGEDIYCCTDLVKIIDLLGSHYMNSFIKRRHEKGFHLYVIRPEKVHKVLCQKGMKRDQSRHIKTVKNIDFYGDIRIYGDKIAFINFEGEVPIGFIIQGGSSTHLFKKLFQFFWEKA